MRRKSRSAGLKKIKKTSNLKDSVKNQLKENRADFILSINRCEKCGSAFESVFAPAGLKCRNCGNNIIINKNLPEISEYKFTEDAIREFEKENIDVSGFLQNDIKSRNNKNVQVLNCSCPSCNNVIKWYYSTSNRCEYCQTPLYINYSMVKDSPIPVAITPNKLTFEEVNQIFRKWYLFNFWRMIFRMKVKFEDVERIRLHYIPAVIYKAVKRVKYKGEYLVSSRSTGRKWQPAEGEILFKTEFNPVAFSGDIIDKYSAEYLDWRKEDLTEFCFEYLSGGKTSFYNRSIVGSIDIAVASFEKKIDDMICKKLGGNDQKIIKKYGKYDKILCYPVLLPVWKCRGYYRNQDIWCVVNGVTGKIIGKSPTPEYSLAAAVSLSIMSISTMLCIYETFFSSDIKNWLVIMLTVVVAFPPGFAFYFGFTKKESLKWTLRSAAYSLLLSLIASAFFSCFIGRISLLYGIIFNIFTVMLFYIIYKVSVSDDFDETELNDKKIKRQ